MKQRKTRVAVIGAGWWGQTHLAAYWRHPDVELAAICVRSNRERGEEIGKQYGANVYLDIEEMLRQETPDLVSVIVPDDQHYQPYMQVIDAGYNCLLEKPLALTLEEGRELVRRARAKGIFCAINFNHRFTTPFRLLAQHQQAGKIGKPHHLLWRFTGGHYPEGQQLPFAHLLYMQSHGFNLLETFGGPLASISGHAGDPRGTGQYTSLTLSLQFISGAVGSFVASVDGDYKDPDIYAFEMMGEYGRAVISDALRQFAYAPRVQQGEPMTSVWQSHFFDDDSRQFARTNDRHFVEMITALRTGQPEPIPIEEGLRAMELGYAAIEAITKRCYVDVAPR